VNLGYKDNIKILYTKKRGRKLYLFGKKKHQFGDNIKKRSQKTFKLTIGICTTRTNFVIGFIKSP